MCLAHQGGYETGQGCCGRKRMNTVVVPLPHTAGHMRHTLTVSTLRSTGLLGTSINKLPSPLHQKPAKETAKGKEKETGKEKGKEADKEKGKEKGKEAAKETGKEAAQEAAQEKGKETPKDQIGRAHV